MAALVVEPHHLGVRVARTGLGVIVANTDFDGFVKVLADQEADEILGVHMVGPRASPKP
ncbi:hypothetical protein DLM85_09025 [Hymenobacter edaphi]|uniref:Pyridine nucleotide-disulphide oxidoreductase dimerisation domain-containing protein n=1 Tax=Hymenobacter edaphi TaxID=2211146 RepID=A0A328BNK2_9BACT|nr:hypothetical protein DLM85_09025 [Hymenobacter edaphi]